MDDTEGSDYGARSTSGPPSSCASAKAKVECVLTFAYAEYLYRNTLSSLTGRRVYLELLLKVVSRP